MTRRCFHSPSLGDTHEVILLDRQVAHHVARVVRLRKGDFLELKDGRGGWCVARVEDPAADSFRVQVVEVLHGEAESPLHFSLCMALARPDRMDTVVRQATELGATRLVGFRSQRSQYGLTKTQREKRRERWERICLEAMCQCGRTRVPQVRLHDDLHGFVEGLEGMGGANVLKILALEETAPHVAASCSRAFDVGPASKPARVIALVGPEGGWAPEEVHYLKGKGFFPVRMGPRILRFETAAVAVLTISQFLWGDMGRGPLEG